MPSPTHKVWLFSCRYDCSADIWSFGITLLEFALGQAPLQNCNLDQILMKTLNEAPPILESADRRKRFTEVCSRCACRSACAALQDVGCQDTQRGGCQSPLAVQPCD